MAYETLGDTVENQILNAITQIPFPTRCTITKVYDDQKHVDIKTDFGDLAYVEVIANNPTVDNIGILVFLNGSNQDYIVITR